MIFPQNKTVWYRCQKTPLQQFQSPFFRLPQELRRNIYLYVLAPPPVPGSETTLDNWDIPAFIDDVDNLLNAASTSASVLDGEVPAGPDLHTHLRKVVVPLLQVCKLACFESMPLFWREHSFCVTGRSTAAATSCSSLPGHISSYSPRKILNFLTGEQGRRPPWVRHLILLGCASWVVLGPLKTLVDPNADTPFRYLVNLHHAYFHADGADNGKNSSLGGWHIRTLCLASRPEPWDFGPAALGEVLHRIVGHTFSDDTVRRLAREEIRWPVKDVMLAPLVLRIADALPRLEHLILAPYGNLRTVERAREIAVENAWNGTLPFCLTLRLSSSCPRRVLDYYESTGKRCNEMTVLQDFDITQRCLPSPSAWAVSGNDDRTLAGTIMPCGCYYEDNDQAKHKQETLEKEMESYDIWENSDEEMFRKFCATMPHQWHTWPNLIEWP